MGQPVVNEAPVCAAGCLWLPVDDSEEFCWIVKRPRGLEADRGSIAAPAAHLREDAQSLGFVQVDIASCDEDIPVVLELAGKERMPD